jgi:hemoglobin-like flavoprotein
MNEQEIEIIRRNWEALRPNARFVARLFYTKLLLIYPSMSRLFRPSCEEQSQRLLRAVGIAVHGIGQPRILRPMLRVLGRLPAVRRLTAGQFDAIAQAMLWALKIALGESFDDAARRAWENLYSHISGALRESAAESQGIAAAEMRLAA